ncbi:two-component hybrid sensor and regulator [Catenovulum agarivorans DS-2]|uniref:histidine kinase n=1 Tax=Catenovulum agarivorans DS-2 TaxID=1328313 RepID=W7QJZ5_9ALTE|nr:response regulator [Catenovulum agarivorans]EWH08448.1 two-component hybrid sensor and regulator [Catenovulum agarivorans DS-2]
MAPNYKKLTHKLKRLHWSFLLLAFIYTLLGQAYIFILMDKQDEYAYYLNLAGRQRMLSQQIQLQAEKAIYKQTSTKELQSLADSQVAFDAALNILIQPNALSLFDSQYFPIVERLYFGEINGINAQVHRYFLAIEAIESPEVKVSIDELQLLHTALLKNLELAVSLVEQQAQTRASDIKLSILLYLLGFFLLLWLSIRKGIQPMEKSIQLALHGGFLNNETNHKNLQKVEYANRLKSELLARATHALRVGLNGVDGMLSLIERQPSDVKPLLKKAKVSSSHMLSIIDSLSNYAELTRQKAHIHPTTVHLNEFFADLCRNYQALASAKDIQFNIDIAPTVPICIAIDEKMLRNVFEPLIANAVRYTEVGNVQLHLGYVDEDNELVAQIHDSGIGISEEQLKSIKQNNIVEKGFNASDNSIGIGLLIVNRAIELMNAHIEITSRLGQGTNVYITLPLVDKPKAYLPSSSQTQMIGKMSYAMISRDPLFIHYYQSVFNSLHSDIAVFTSLSDYTTQDSYSVVLVDLAAVETDAKLEQMRGQYLCFNAALDQPKYPNLARFTDTEQLLQHIVEQMPIASIRTSWPGKRVLVAEDNEINQEVISSLLEGFQLDVQVASNGLTAADTVFKMNFDLILMDIQMPILDGIEATRKIRETGSQVPIVALTAHTYRTDEKLCFDVGMNGFVSKPIQPDKLVKVLSRFLS